MTLFPPETTFFINAWTWGYEDIFRAVARSFQSQVRFSSLFLSVSMGNCADTCRSLQAHHLLPPH